MQTENNKGFISFTVNNKIATVTFSHPAANSLPSYLLEELAEVFNSLSHNPGVLVILLKSDGEKAFCAGASFSELKAVSNYEDGAIYFSGFANVINAMRSCNKIIVGCVQGKAVGGGVGLIAACDYVIAAQSASVRLPELNIGIGPFVIAPAVQRKTGSNALAEMCLDTEWKTAEWAQRNGLFNKLADDFDALNKLTDEFAMHLSSKNPEALLSIKKMLWEDTDDWDKLLPEKAKITGRLALSEFTKKAINAQ